ncbi:MAG: EutN/CcmL family microcompartment protein [bacterium]
MNLGQVIGVVVATQKDPSLVGSKICILQPLDEDLQPQGRSIIATDSTAMRNVGEIVFYVESGDAVFTGQQGEPIPVDAAVVGIVDKVSLKERGKAQQAGGK